MSRGRPSIAAWPFIALIRVYRVTLSPIIGNQCRFEPTCSRYALDAYNRYGVVRATMLTVRRILRCHPFSRGGYDPVPLDHEPPDPAVPDQTRQENSREAGDHHESR